MPEARQVSVPAGFSPIPMAGYYFHCKVFATEVFALCVGTFIEFFGRRVWLNPAASVRKEAQRSPKSAEAISWLRRLAALGGALVAPLSVDGVDLPRSVKLADVVAHVPMLKGQQRGHNGPFGFARKVVIIGVEVRAPEEQHVYSPTFMIYPRSVRSGM